MNPKNGKGSAPRKGADNKKFANNWDRIFSKKKETTYPEKKSKD